MLPLIAFQKPAEHLQHSVERCWLHQAVDCGLNYPGEFGSMLETRHVLQIVKTGFITSQKNQNILKLRVQNSMRDNVAKLTHCIGCPARRGMKVLNAKDYNTTSSQFIGNIGR